MPAQATSTINPLHFEDLESHRFEDLVRQLAYDFKEWRKLEATGRAGSDDGFDIRGWEVWKQPEASDNDEEELPSEPFEDRLWLIQCKREKAINPKKLSNYLAEIDFSNIHGVIFAAACDFSKKAKDIFIEACRKAGVQECYLWGKAELEDLLFQPKNDHLLFAYFNISLQIRKRSLKSNLRSMLVTKRKLHRALKNGSFPYVLLRDPSDDRYPYLQENNPDDVKWRVARFDKFITFGPEFVLRRHFAYLADDGIGWDFVEDINDEELSSHQNPWAKGEKDFALRQRVYAFWDALPEHNKAWLEISGVIPYEDILEVDDLGDDWFEQPHIYVSFQHHECSPYKYRVGVVRTRHRYSPRELQINSPKENRISFFPAVFPEINLAPIE